MIGRTFAPGSSARRLVLRALVVLGAVFVGGQVMQTLPHEQTLIFPVGSVFPNATRFSASWKQAGESEPRGGVTLTFNAAPPLQIREHAKLPNGDYIVSMDILERAENRQSSAERGGLQTSLERRVNLVGGETTIQLTVHREAERF